MWSIEEIDALKKVTQFNIKLDTFLSKDEINVIRGDFYDGKWSNAIRYLNLRNDVFATATKKVFQVLVYFTIFLRSDKFGF